MFMNFHAHPLHILWVINIVALQRFFLPLVYNYSRCIHNAILGLIKFMKKFNITAVINFVITDTTYMVIPLFYVKSL